MDTSAFVYYWIIFAVLVPVFSAAVFLLARKAGYLKNQDRLRYLALWAEVPDDGANSKSETRNPGDRVTPPRLPLNKGRMGGVKKDRL